MSFASLTSRDVAFRLLHRGAGAALAIAIMELLAHVAGEPLARVPFVTSIVLVIALPGTEPARPASVVGGHLASSLSGLAALWLLGPGEVASSVAVGLATVAMITARVLHPPAGIDAFLIASLSLPATWVLNPVLAGAVLLVGYAKVWQAAEVRIMSWLDHRLGKR